MTEDQSTILANGLKEEKHTASPRSTRCDQNHIDDRKHADHPIQNHAFSNECRSSVNSECSMNDDTEEQTHSTETTVWIRCDVYDTGIGIPGRCQ